MEEVLQLIKHVYFILTHPVPLYKILMSVLYGLYYTLCVEREDYQANTNESCFIIVPEVFVKTLSVQKYLHQ